MRTERLSIERNGQTRYVDIVVYPLKADEVTGAVIRVDDITQRARLEQTMVQTEKMLSVGGLAAGMAHEINNPLSGVLQSCQNIQRRLSTDLPANRAMADSMGLDLGLVRQYLEERGILSFVFRHPTGGQSGQPYRGRYAGLQSQQQRRVPADPD